MIWCWNQPSESVLMKQRKPEECEEAMASISGVLTESIKTESRLHWNSSTAWPKFMLIKFVTKQQNFVMTSYK